MNVGADKGSLVTIGGHDPRVTRSGYFIRKFKIDELPQLINVFIGDMSLVGPRPEVRHYVHIAPIGTRCSGVYGTGLARNRIPALKAC